MPLSTANTRELTQEQVQRLGAPAKEVPQVAGGEPLTAVTLELAGAPGWVLLTSGLVGAVVFGTATWFLLGALARRRLRS